MLEYGSIVYKYLSLQNCIRSEKIWLRINRYQKAKIFHLRSKNKRSEARVKLSIMYHGNKSGHKYIPINHQSFFQR